MAVEEILWVWEIVAVGSVSVEETVCVCVLLWLLRECDRLYIGVECVLWP